MLLFDDGEEEDDGDLFSSMSTSQPKCNATAAPQRVEQVPKKGVPVEDDDHDDAPFASIFAALKSAAKLRLAKKVVPATVSNDSDSGDLFAGVQEVSAKPDVKEPAPESDSDSEDAPPVKVALPQKKLPPGAVSMFSSAPNPLVAALKTNQVKPQSVSKDSDGWSEDDKGSTPPTITRYTPVVTKQPTPPLTTKPLGNQDSRNTHGSSLQPPAMIVGRRKEPSPSPSSSSLFAEKPEVVTLAVAPHDQIMQQHSSKPKLGGLFEKEGEHGGEDLFTASRRRADNKSVGASVVPVAVTGTIITEFSSDLVRASPKSDGTDQVIGLGMDPPSSQTRNEFSKALPSGDNQTSPRSDESPEELVDTILWRLGHHSSKWPDPIHGVNQSTWEPGEPVGVGIPLSSPSGSDQTKQGPSSVEVEAGEPGTSAVKAGFPLTPGCYPEVQDIMADFEAMTWGG